MNLEDAENELRGTIKLGLVDSVSGYIEAAEYAFEAALVIIKARESRIAELEKQNAELQAENEQMRNCENCGNHIYTNEFPYEECLVNLFNRCPDANYSGWKSEKNK